MNINKIFSKNILPIYVVTRLAVYESFYNIILEPWVFFLLSGDFMSPKWYHIVLLTIF